MATSSPMGDGDERTRAALIARAAPVVGDAIARAHAASLREAGANSPQGKWLQESLNRELEAARSTLHRVLADEARRGDARQLADLLELCRIWRDVDPEFAEHETHIANELTHRHGIPVQPDAPVGASVQDCQTGPVMGAWADVSPGHD